MNVEDSYRKADHLAEALKESRREKMAKMFKKVFKPEEYRTEKMMDAIMTMKMSKKQLERQAAKMEKTAEVAKKKVRKALEQGDVESAKIHAETSVRSQSGARNFYKMAGKVDAVASRMKEAMATKNLSKNMEQVVKGMSSALSTMTPENMATNLQQFEELSDTLGVNTDFLDLTIAGATKMGQSDGEVQELLEQTADAVGLEKLEIFDDLAKLPLPLAERKKKTEEEAAAAEEEA